MRGEAPTIPDIELDLRDLVTAVDLQCNETLSPDFEAVPEPPSPYKVVSSCFNCGCKLRIFVVASSGSIRNFHQLLLGNLSFLCVTCGKVVFSR
ncbi:E7 protein [Bos taurus papillomavirus 17]|uniref:Protein E7 n=1 Tax=Bos taurus papillomavirus 17 TaxID=1887215 RepID=A0A1B2K202_9PAPI|nr:E7 protein [Bos taurus papillomavirus 17]ANZ90239.1 E7 protein [Bos taurus papillomavirus 17]